jgi:DNA helicase MCM9
MARTPRANPTPAATQHNTQTQRAPPPPRDESEGWRRLSRRAWKEKFAAFVRRPRDGRRALQAVVSGEDAAGNARGVGVPVDLCELARFDAGAAQGLLRGPEKLLPVFDEALNDCVQELLQSPTMARHPDWHARKARARLCHCPPLPAHRKPNVSALRCGDVGPLVQIEGTVVRTGAVRVLEAARTYRCLDHRCDCTFVVTPDATQGNIFEAPKRCPGQEGGCGSRRFAEVERENADYQELRVQEHVERLGVGAIPRSLTVVVTHDLADASTAGDAVAVVGYLERVWQPHYKDVRVDVDLVLRACDVRPVSAAHAPGAARATKEDVTAFKALWRRAERSKAPLVARDVLIDSVCPRIFGRRTLKLAVLLTAVGGVGSDERDADEGGDGTRTRGTPHLLLVGDPGTGKSQFLRFMAKLAPRSILTTGCGTTSAGLTCSAVKDNGAWTLEAGALVLADRGVCCIDEFGAIKAGDRAAIHEAMEQQTLSVAKAGLVCTLAARCAVMACCNPKGGAFDNRADLSVNTSLPPSLLSRFDVILVVVDAPDAPWDTAVSAQILNASIRPGAGTLDPFADDGSGERPGKRKRVAPRPKAWSLDKLRRYVAHVREKYKPTIGDDAARIVEAYYARQRRGATAVGGRATIRMLESLVRIAQAHARLCCRDECNAQDAVVACLLVDKSMGQNVSFSAETDPIAELTVSTDSDAYYLYQYAQVSAALGLGCD